MSDPYIGEIRMFGGNFAPAGWYFCDGATLSISQYEALFALIGTTYGGDGQNTFALPDLRGRVPVHMGAGPGLPQYTLGQRAGTEQIALTVANLPSHSHPLQASTGAGTTSTPGNTEVLANPGSPVLYSDTTDSVINLSSASVTPMGGSQPFSKLMPYQVINFIIAYEGIYPQQN